MSAGMHVIDVDAQWFYDDAMGFLREHGEPPGRDVTRIRDSDEVPGHVKEAMYADALEPHQMLVLADSLYLALSRGISDEAVGLDAAGLAYWLRHWAAKNCAVEGMH